MFQPMMRSVWLFFGKELKTDGFFPHPEERVGEGVLGMEDLDNS